MEQRLFEDLIDSDRVAHRTQQSKTLPVSLALHTVAAALIVIVPLLSADQLPDPASAVKAFFVEPMAAPAPPPPPPPPAARPANAPKIIPKPILANQFTAPVEVPEEITPEESIDMGVEGGAGGVEGGVPGGVVGGIVGGLPREAPAPPAPVVRIGGKLVAPRRVHGVAPIYPEVALQGGIGGTVVVDAHVDVNGRVKSVRLVSGNPLFEPAALDAVRQWRYQPLLLNGVPCEFMLVVTITFNVQRR
jgi:protein TonB